MKYASLQLGRGVAAVMVVGHHIDGKLAIAFPSAPPFLSGLLEAGWAGVDFFFVLSGFIIALSLDGKPDVRTFALRRFTRIYPPFWAAFGLSLAGALLLPSMRQALAAYSSVEWALALALLPADNNAPVIGVAWTLHHEILFYAVTALWIVRPAWSVMTAVALLLGSLFLDRSNFPATFVFSLMHWEFLFGVLAYVGHRRLPARLHPWLMVTGIGWLASWALIAPSPNLAGDGGRVLQYGIGFALLCMATASAECQAKRTGAPSKSRWYGFADHLGNWSFALYLIHIPIILTFVRALQRLETPASWLVQCTGLAAFASCLIAAGLFHQHIERPLARILNRRAA